MMKKTLLTVSLAMILAACGAEEKKAEKPVEPAATSEKATAASATDVASMSESDKISYAIGVTLATQFQRGTLKFVDAGYQFNHALMEKGVSDALKGTPDMQEADIQQLLRTFHQEASEKVREMEQKTAQENVEKGKAFLAENAKKEGVVTLDNGLQYKVISAGEGDKPKASDRVKVHYKGTLIDGTEFDSSYKRGQPAQFAVGGVIKGWQEALQLMPAGSKWELYIPSELAYGERGTPSIPGNSTLIFEVELLEIVGSPAAQAAAEKPADKPEATKE
tara:strand:+ start:1203 stop:2036 length:834 start_codon:yes stop_codon:yes gene_type:complete